MGGLPGGVGLLIRKGWPCRRVEVAEDDALASALWNSGRWLHVCLALGDGRATANLQVLYGISGQPALNAELFGLVMEYRARLVGTASLLAMDASFNLDKAEGYPSAVLMALATWWTSTSCMCRPRARPAPRALARARALPPALTGC